MAENITYDINLKDLDKLKKLIDKLGDFQKKFENLGKAIGAPKENIEINDSIQELINVLKKAPHFTPKAIRDVHVKIDPAAASYTPETKDMVSEMSNRLAKIINHLESVLKEGMSNISSSLEKTGRNVFVPEGVGHTVELDLSGSAKSDIEKLRKELPQTANSIRSVLQTYMNPQIITPTTDVSKNFENIWSKGTASADKMNALVDNLSKSLNKLQDNIVKAVETGLSTGGWKILENIEGKKQFNLAEGGREWELTLVNVPKLKGALRNVGTQFEKGESPTALVGKYKEHLFEEYRKLSERGPDIAAKVEKWMKQVNESVLSGYSIAIQDLARKVKSGEMGQERLGRNVGLRSIYEQTVLSDIAMGDIRKQFFKSVGLPAAKISSQGTLSFETKYGRERSLASFATITTGLERMAEEYKKLAGREDVYKEYVSQIRKLPFRVEKETRPDVYEKVNKLAESLFKDLKAVGSTVLGKEGLTTAIKVRRLERGESLESVTKELSSMSLEDLKKQFKELKIDFKEVADALNKIDYSNFYDILDKVYQAGKVPFIQTKAGGISGFESERSVRDIAKVKDALLGMMPVVEPGRPKRKLYDEEVVRVLTRVVESAAGTPLRPEEQKQHMVDVALTWQEMVNKAKKLEEGKLYANLEDKIAKAIGIVEARPIDLSDAASSQIEEFGASSESVLRELNKMMVSSSTAGIRGLAPFEKYSSIQRQMSYAANALAGGLRRGTAMELPSLRSEREQEMIATGRYGRGGYGFNVLTELRSTASTFEDQILISGKLAEAFTKIVKPLVGPAASFMEDISEFGSGIKRLSPRGGELGSAEAAKAIGISKEYFEDMIKNVTEEYQKILGISKGVKGRQDIAYLADEVVNVMRTHRGETIEVQTAKLTEIFMNYFGRKFSTRFGTKGVSVTPRYEELPKSIKSLEDVGEYVKRGFKSKIAAGTVGIGAAEIPKSVGELLAELFEGAGGASQELNKRLVESGNKFIIDLFKDAGRGLVTKEEAEKQSKLFEDATKHYEKVFARAELPTGVKGIEEVTSAYSEFFEGQAGRGLHRVLPIEARISARGVAKRGLMPEVLEGLVNNLVGTGAGFTVLKNAELTSDKQLREDMNKYLKALSYQPLSEKETAGMLKRLTAEGAKPEQLEEAKKFEKQWNVYTDIIDEYGRKMQSFISPKFMQIVEEPHIYKEWSKGEVERGEKGVKLNYPAFAAYAGVFGEGSQMMKELSSATAGTAQEGWELIQALKLMDPSMKDLAKTMMESLKTYSATDIKPFIEGTATLEELKGTLLDLQKFPTAFKLRIPSTNIRSPKEYEELYIPGAAARATYPEELMGGKVAPVNIARYLSNLVESARKVQELVDISNKQQSGLMDEAYEKSADLIKKDFVAGVAKNIKEFSEKERSAKVLTPGFVDVMNEYIKYLKQGLSKTAMASPLYAPEGATRMTELEAAEAWEKKLKAETPSGKYYGQLMGRISDLLIGAVPENLAEETESLYKVLNSLKEGRQLSEFPQVAGKFEKYKGAYGTPERMIESFIARNEEKLQTESALSKALKSGTLKDFAEKLGLDLEINVKDALESALQSLSRAKASYADELAKAVIGPKQAVEKTFFQRTVPGSITAKAVTGIADKTEDLSHALYVLKTIGDESFSGIISSLEEVNRQHNEFIENAKQRGVPVLKEGEIGIHPELAEKITTTVKGSKSSLKRLIEQDQEAYVTSVRYPFTGTLSVQPHRARFMESKLARHAVAVPGAPELDIAKLKTEIIGPLNEKLEELISRREEVWETGGEKAPAITASLTEEIGDLLRVIREITPKYTNMEQKLDFDGDALFLHTGQVESSREEIKKHFEALGKDIESVRSLFNTIFTAVEETDAKALSEMAYQFEKKHPEAAGFKFLEKSYIEEEVKNIKNVEDVFKALATYHAKGQVDVEKWISTHLQDVLLPEVFRKLSGMGTEAEKSAFAGKAIAGGGKVELEKEPSKFEKAAADLLEEMARTKLWQQKYSDAIVGQLYKLHTGQTVEGISRLARLSELETGFGGGLIGTLGGKFKPSEKFLEKWPEESIALGGKPVEEFATRMNEIMRFTIQKGLDEKHAGVSAVGSQIIANVAKQTGAKTIMKVMEEEADQFKELTAFNEQIGREVKLRLGKYPTETLRKELRRFHPEDISEAVVGGMSREDLMSAITKQIDLEAVFEELFRMIKRQAVEGLTKKIQLGYEAKSAKEKREIGAIAGSDVEAIRKHATSIIESEAVTKQGINIRQAITENLEPLYQMRTSMEKPWVTGGRSGLKIKESGLLTSGESRDVENRYINALKTANVLSKSMKTALTEAGGGAYSAMVITSAQKRMQNLLQLEEVAKKFNIPVTGGGGSAIVRPMSMAGGRVGQVSTLFADVWERAYSDIFKEGEPSEGSKRWIKRSKGGFEKIQADVKKRLSELSDEVNIPMMTGEEEFAALGKYLQDMPGIYENIELLAKKYVKEPMIAMQPGAVSEAKLTEIEKVTDDYTEFLKRLFKFQASMSEQANRITESMQLVGFQKTLLEESFPGITEKAMATPVEIAKDKPLKKEYIEEDLYKRQQAAKSILAALRESEGIGPEEIKKEDERLSRLESEIKEIKASSSFWSAGGGLAGGGAAAGGAPPPTPPGGMGGAGGGPGGGPPIDIEQLIRFLKAIRAKIEASKGRRDILSPKEVVKVISAYKELESAIVDEIPEPSDYVDNVEEIMKRERETGELDVSARFKEPYASKVKYKEAAEKELKAMKEALDKYYLGTSTKTGFQFAEEIYLAYERASALKDIPETRKFDYSQLANLGIVTEHPETAEAMHKNLKALLEVAKRRQSKLSPLYTKDFPRAVQSMLTEVAEAGPSMDITSKIMAAVKDLPKESRRFAIPIWQNYRKAVGDYFIKQLDDLKREMDETTEPAALEDLYRTYTQTIKAYRENIIKNLGKVTDIYTEPGLGGMKEFVHPELAKLTGVYRTPEEIAEIFRESTRLSGEYQPIMDMLIGSVDPDQIEGLVTPIGKVREAFKMLTENAVESKNVLKDPNLFGRPEAIKAASEWDFSKTVEGITQLRAGLESWNRLQTAGTGVMGPQAAYGENQRKNIEETIKLFKQLEKAFIPTGGAMSSEMGMVGVPAFLSVEQQEVLHRRNIAKIRQYFAKPERAAGEVAGGPKRGEVFNYRYRIIDPATKQTIRSVAEEFKSLGDHVDRAGNKIGVFTHKSEDMLEQFQRRRGFGQAFGRVIRWGLASNVVYGSVSALRDMVNTISDVELGIATLRQVMNPLEADFDEITQSALDFAKNFGQPIRSVIDSMRVFAQQGLGQKEVIDRARTSQLAANVTTLSASDATEALTAAMKVYGGAGEESVRFLDSWSQVEARHAITSADLANAMKKAAAVAKTSGVTFDELNAIVTGIGETSRQTGKEIGTSLRFMFRRIQGEKGPQELGKIGIPVISATGDLRKGFDILGDLANKWGELSNAQRLSIAQAIGGRRHYNSLIILMDHWSEVLDTLEDSINSKGAAERRNAIVMETYAKKLQQVKASMVELQVQFGKFALPIAKVGLTGLKFLIETITSIPASVKIAFVSLSSLFALFTKGSSLIDKFNQSFIGTGNVFTDFFKSSKSELQKGVYEVFGKGMGGISLDKMFGANKGDPLGLKSQFKGLRTVAQASGLSDLETGLGKSVYLLSILGRGWNNFLTDLTKGGASTTKKISDMLDYLGGKLVAGGVGLAEKGGWFGGVTGALTAALGTTSEMAGYGTEKVAKYMGLTAQQMAKLTDSSTGVVGALGPMVGSFFALKPLVESSWDGFKKLALTASDYEKSIDSLRQTQSGELSDIKDLSNEYNTLGRRLEDIAKSMAPDVRARKQEREEYISPLHELGKLYGDATEYGNKLASVNLDLISGFDEFGNALVRTTDNLKGYLSVLESAQTRKMADVELGVLGEYVEDLTKTTGVETFKNEFKIFLSEIPVIGELLAKSIKVSPAKSLDELKTKMEKLVEVRNKYPLTTSFDVDLTEYNEKLAKARTEYRETYDDFMRVLSGLSTEGLNTRQITEMFNKPEFTKGFEVIANIEPRLQTNALKGKVGWEDILGTEVMKRVYPGKQLDFTAQLTKGLLEQSNIRPREKQAFVGDIVLFTEDIAKKYEVAGNQAILNMRKTSKGLVEWVVEFFDKELMGMREVKYDKVSKFVDSVFPVQAISDRLYENVEVLKEFVAGAGAGLRGVTEKTFKREFSLGERFFSQLPTTTLLQSTKGYEPGIGFGEVPFKAGWDKWIDKNFFEPMTEYTQLLDQLADMEKVTTGEIEMSPALMEDISRLQDVLKNNQVVLQYRAAHEDLIKTISEGERSLQENIVAEQNRNEYIVQSSGFLKGFAEDISDINTGVQKYSELTNQQRLALRESNRMFTTSPYTKSREAYKEDTLRRQALVESITNVDKTAIAIKEIGNVARSFGAALPTQELANYIEEVAKTGDKGTGMLLGETKKVSENTGATVDRLDQLLEQGGDEEALTRIVDRVSGKGSILRKLESLTEKRNKMAARGDADRLVVYDRAIDKLTTKLIEEVGPKAALKAIGRGQTRLGTQDYTQAEFIKRALGNTNFEGFSKALERVQPGITKTKEFTDLVALQKEQSEEQIVSNKNLNKILAAYSTIEHFNRVSSNKQLKGIDAQINELEEQRKAAEEAGKTKDIDEIVAKLEPLRARRAEVATKMESQFTRELIAPLAIASEEFAKSMGVTDKQMRVLGGTVGGSYLAWKAWNAITGEPVPEYIEELGKESAEAAQKMMQPGIKGQAWRTYYGAKDLVFGKDLDRKLKEAEAKIKGERVLTDEELKKATEGIVREGAEGPKLSEKALTDKIKSAFAASKEASISKEKPVDDKILDENSAQTGILHGIYEQTRRTAENTTSFSANLSDEIKKDRDDRSAEVTSILNKVDVLRGQYLESRGVGATPLKQITAALVSAAAAGYVSTKREQRGRVNELENRAEEQAELINKIIKKYRKPIEESIEDFYGVIETTKITQPVDMEKVQQVVNTEEAESKMLARLEELKQKMATSYEEINEGMEEAAEKIAKLELAEEMKRQLEDLENTIKGSKAIDEFERKFITEVSGLLSGLSVADVGGDFDTRLSQDLTAHERLTVASRYERPFIGRFRRLTDKISDFVGAKWEDMVTDPLTEGFHKLTFKIFKPTYTERIGKYSSALTERSALQSAAEEIIQEMYATPKGTDRYEALADNLEEVEDRIEDLNDDLEDSSAEIIKLQAAEQARINQLIAASNAAAKFASTVALVSSAAEPFSYLSKLGLSTTASYGIEMPKTKAEMTPEQIVLATARETGNKALEEGMQAYAALTIQIAESQQVYSDQAEYVSKLKASYIELEDKLGKNNAQVRDAKELLEEETAVLESNKAAVEGTVEKLKEYNGVISALNIGQIISDMRQAQTGYEADTATEAYRKLTKNVDRIVGGASAFAKAMPTTEMFQMGIAPEQMINMTKAQAKMVSLYARPGQITTAKELSDVYAQDYIDRWSEVQGEYNDELSRQRSLGERYTNAFEEAVRRTEGIEGQEENVATIRRIWDDFNKTAETMGTVREATPEELAKYGELPIQYYNVPDFKEPIRQLEDILKEMNLPGFENIEQFAELSSNPVVYAIDTNTTRLVKAILEGRDIIEEKKEPVESESKTIFSDSVWKYFFEKFQKSTAQMAVGGSIKGSGGPREDKVPIMASPGEYVVKASSAKNIGYDALNYMNTTGKLPGFANGGSVYGGVEASKIYDEAGNVKMYTNRPDILYEKEQAVKRYLEESAAKSGVKPEAVKKYIDIKGKSIEEVNRELGLNKGELLAEKVSTIVEKYKNEKKEMLLSQMESTPYEESAFKETLKSRGLFANILDAPLGAIRNVFTGLADALHSGSEKLTNYRKGLLKDIATVGIGKKEAQWKNRFKQHLYSGATLLDVLTKTGAVTSDIAGGITGVAQLLTSPERLGIASSNVINFYKNNIAGKKGEFVTTMGASIGKAIAEAPASVAKGNVGPIAELLGVSIPFGGISKVSKLSKTSKISEIYGEPIESIIKTIPKDQVRIASKFNRTDVRSILETMGAEGKGLLETGVSKAKSIWDVGAPKTRGLLETAATKGKGLLEVGTPKVRDFFSKMFKRRVKASTTRTGRMPGDPFSKGTMLEKPMTILDYINSYTTFPLSLFPATWLVKLPVMIDKYGPVMFDFIKNLPKAGAKEAGTEFLKMGTAAFTRRYPKFLKNWVAKGGKKFFRGYADGGVVSDTGSKSRQEKIAEMEAIVEKYKDYLPEEVAEEKKSIFGRGLDKIKSAINSAKEFKEETSEKYDAYVHDTAQKHVDYINEMRAAQGLEPLGKKKKEEGGNIPSFHTGGVVPGIGNQLVYAKGGEIVAQPLPPMKASKISNIDPEEIGEKMANTIVDKLSDMEFKPLKLEKDTIEISNVDEIERALSNFSSNRAVGADAAAAKIDEFIEVSTSRFETFSSKIDDQDIVIQDITSTINDTKKYIESIKSDHVDIESIKSSLKTINTSLSSFMTRDELNVKDSVDKSDLRYKLHETIVYLEDHYLNNIKNSITLLDNKIYNLSYDLNDTKDLVDANISRLGLRG